MSPAKMAEPIEMPFGLWPRVYPRKRKHVLDGVQKLQQEGGTFRGVSGPLQSTRCRGTG